MSLSRRLLLSLGLCVAAAPAAAQTSDDGGRFFVFSPAVDESETQVVGTLTSTSFFYGEHASGEDPLIVPDPGGVVIPAEVDSPRSRLFTDLRARVDAKHISGTQWESRFDVRGRAVPSDKVQSGQFHGNELDAREVFIGRNGDFWNVHLGRQFAYELAATKFDGLKLGYIKNDKWRYLGFAGLYPTRGSRSIEHDYPHEVTELGGEPGKRVLPITAGGGAAYRYRSLYGSFGAVGIYAPNQDLETGNTERTRVFLTANGYWRESSELDIYHFVVADVESASGRALTNFTLGAHYTPRRALRVNANVTHIDTETLNVQAQTRLEDPGNGAPVNVVLNNIEVRRLSQDEARLSVSGAFMENRFEVSAGGSVRKRPEVTLRRDNGDDILLPSAQAADVAVSITDRRLFGDIRAQLSYSRAFGLGDRNVNRSEFQVVHLAGQRDFRGGKGSVEGSFTFVSSADLDNGMACNSGLDPLPCYGTSTARTYTVGLMGTYRLEKSWLGILSASLGRQNITVEDVAQQRLSLPAINTLGAFFRLVYRF